MFICSGIKELTEYKLVLYSSFKQQFTKEV